MSHTVRFPMENPKPSERDINNYISRLVKPIFEKVAQEAVKNRMMVGGTVSKNEKYCLFQPHNYRLYIDFKKENFEPETVLPTTVRPMFPMEHKIINKTSHTYNEFYGCRITVRKTQVEIINKKKEWYKISLNISKIKPQIKQIIIDKDRECFIALRQFIRIFGGSSKFKVLNRHSENKIKGENMIDLIPIKQHWHTDVVKKVYNESNVEFNDPAFASNYLRSRALEDKAETMENDISEIKEAVKATVKINTDTCLILNKFTKQIDLHLSVLKGIKKAFKRFNNRLSQKNLKEWM